MAYYSRSFVGHSGMQAIVLCNSLRGGHTQIMPPYAYHMQDVNFTDERGYHR